MNMQIALPCSFCRRLNLVPALLVLMVCAGCTAVNETATVNVTTRVLTTAEKNQVEALLMDAEAAMAKNHLSFPQQGSAASLLQKALSIDPINDRAQRGLEQILEQYVALALKAANRGETSAAKTLLQRGRLLDAQHPSIAPAEEFLKTINTSHRETVTLRGLSSEDLKKTVDALVLGVDQSCRFRISAASDARARYLYRLLRDSFARNHLKHRPRAASDISTPERMERICNYENT